MARLPRPPRFCARYSLNGWLFDVTGVAKGDHHVGGVIRSSGREVLRTVLNGGSGAAPELGLAKLGFSAQSAHRRLSVETRAGWVAKMSSKSSMTAMMSFVFGDDFVLLQAGQAL